MQDLYDLWNFVQWAWNTHPLWTIVAALVAPGFIKLGWDFGGAIENAARRET